MKRTKLPSSEKLWVKASTLPGAGYGLFTKTDIAKGEIITQYQGRLCTWQEVENDADNGYIYFIDELHVIDAAKTFASFGRYANDAAGLQRVAGKRNNSVYHEDGNSVFIKATRKISAGNEVFVAYGAKYWKQVRDNIKADAVEN